MILPRSDRRRFGLREPLPRGRERSTVGAIGWCVCAEAEVVKLT